MAKNTGAYEPRELARKQIILALSPLRPEHAVQVLGVVVDDFRRIFRESFQTAPADLFDKIMEAASDGMRACREGSQCGEEVH